MNSWETIPSDAGIFVVWDPIVNGPYSLEWDGVITIWDNKTDWDNGNTTWGDPATTWRK